MSLPARSLAGIALTLIGCSSGGTQPPRPLDPLASATFTEDLTVVPVHPRTLDERSSGDPDLRETMLSEGLGDEMQGPGEGYLTRAEDGTPPATGPNPQMLVRFAHFADLQLADDESPTRVAALDGPGALGGAYRPQDVYMCYLVRAMVRTLNAVNAATPLSFVMLGGDNADSAQQNEHEWVLSLLSGGELECDSGDDDDLVPGANNDPKDPLVSPGLDVPWYWVTGNHDVLVQGNFIVGDKYEAQAIGTTANLGTRDWRLPGGPIVGRLGRSAEVPADPRRNPLSGAEILARVFDDGDGHGIPEAQVATGEANYVLDVEGTPLRFLVVDTAAEQGGSEGAIRRADFEGTIKPLLDESEAMQKYVIVVSHHAPVSFQTDKDPEEFVTPEEWEALLTSHPAVLFTLVAHSHINLIDRLDGERPIWMVYTAALADYPHQSRLLEIWDEDNGYLRIHTSTLDFSVEGDPIAADGRQLGTLDYVTGWSFDDGPGTPEDRNVDLFVPKLYQ
jgi:3',5'-cyclic AMP phosphodiesterase CpdA